MMKMPIICFTPYMDTIVEVWINKCIVQGKSVSLSNTFLAVRIMPMPSAIVLLMCKIWGDQFNLLSAITPTNSVSFTSDIRFPFISMSSTFRGKHLGVNNMKLVFSTFNDNLFAFIQEYILSISTLISFPYNLIQSYNTLQIGVV